VGGGKAGRMRTLGALLLATLVLLGPVPAQAQSPTAERAGRQCLPGGGPDRSLIVTGRLSCPQAKRLYPASIELAAATLEEGNRRFRFDGYACTLRRGGEISYTCRDTRPKRSFTVTYT